MKRIKLGISLGDPGGIGPEIIARLLGHSPIYKLCDPVIFGSRSVLEDYLRLWKIKFTRYALQGETQYRTGSGTFCLLQPKRSPRDEPQRGKITKANGRLSLEYLRAGWKAAQAGEIDGLVTGPVCKESIAKIQPSFRGQTELLSRWDQNRMPVMFFVSDKLNVALQTRHISLRRVATSITTKSIVKTLRIIHMQASWLGIKPARICVCALNPHGGEKGLMGHEDDQIIAPAVRIARRDNIDVEGPCAGDTAFYHALQGRYNIVLAMYHDQGLAPFKSIAFDKGIQISLGLSCIRTSPDHGPAFDIAGKKKASVHSFWQAVQMAASMIQKKKNTRFRRL